MYYMRKSDIVYEQTLVVYMNSPLFLFVLRTLFEPSALSHYFLHSSLVIYNLRL
jgi:hypothetical protein